MRYPVTTLFLLAFLCACTTDAMKTEDIGNVQASCANVDQQIAMLEKEKEENNKRLSAGVQSVLPVSAVYHLVSGNYGQNVSIATGEWAAEIDAKITELKDLKATCPDTAAH
jgi:hypothetical protein